MNRHDRTLIIIIGIIILLSFLLLIWPQDEKEKIALVYYQDELKLTIDLSKKEEKTYTVEGENGLVTLKTKDGKIKVVEEKSPLHLCSKQGYIEKNYETIVCLPNKITIKIESNNALDTIAK